MQPRSSKAVRPNPVIVVTAADDRYALPLAVMGRSLIDKFSPDRRLVLYVLDGGIRARSRRKVLGSWDLTKVEVRWTRPSLGCLRGIPVFPRFGLASYFRLLIPEVLPRTTRRAVYVDADTLILDDLSSLWSAGLEDKALGAVQDPWVMSLSDSGIPQAEFRAPATEPYFNSGVLLMDLERWRRQRLARNVLEYLKRRKSNVRFPDQDALNAVFAGNWHVLHPRWNLSYQGRGSLHHVPVTQRFHFAEAIACPGILHYLAGPKPWQKGSRSHRLFLYYYYLDRTRWAGWRPI
jgi:lipopolysaccharide biosynthesis glycosyltransferase